MSFKKTKLLWSIVVILGVFCGCSQALYEPDNFETDSKSEIQMELEKEILQAEIELVNNYQEKSKCLNICNSTINSREIIEKAYYYFGTGDIDSFASLLDENITWEHVGPGEYSAIYGRYYGISGFYKWLNNLNTFSNMFIFDLKCLVAENNYVHGHITEGAQLNNGGGIHIIENFHSFKVNNEGKICKVVIISESYPVVESIMGESGEKFETEYKYNDFEISNPAANNTFRNKILTYLVIKLINRNQGKLASYLFTLNNSEFISTGTDKIVPFNGKFTGRNEIAKLFKILKKESVEFDIDYIIAEANKVDIYMTISGLSNSTGKTFKSKANFNFQFDEFGLIKSVFTNWDTFKIIEAYKL